MGKLGGRKKCGEAEKTGKGAEFKAVVEIGRKLAEKVQAEIRQKSGRGGDNREGGGDFNNPLNIYHRLRLHSLGVTT